MAVKVREELVGKRFVSLKEGSWARWGALNPRPPLLASDLDWRCGVIRAVSTSPPYLHDQDLTVLVEYDDIDWHDRQWVTVCERFEVFLIEETVAWVPHKFIQQSESSPKLLPALTFKALIDKIGLNNNEIITKPVQFLADKHLAFIDRGLTLQTFKEKDLTSEIPICDDPFAMECVRKWMEYQDGQKILLQTPSILIGYRVQVYRSEGTTQWYTAVIKSCCEDSRMLDVTDDTVLEEHQVNPMLVQVNLLGDGVINSILRGEESGTRASRTRRLCCRSIRYNLTSLSSPLKANKRQSDTKGRNLSVTCEQINEESVNSLKKEDLVKPYSENFKVDSRKKNLLNGTCSPHLNSKKLLKQSNFASNRADGKICNNKVSAKLKTSKKQLGHRNNTVAKQDLTESITSPILLVEQDNKCIETASSINDHQDNLAQKSCINLNGIELRQHEIIENKCENNLSVQKQCGQFVMKRDQRSSPGSNNKMPKLKGPAAATSDFLSNSAETKESKEQLQLLKSVASMRHAMSLLPPKTVANLPSASPAECLNLSAKTPEVRKQFLSLSKTTETGPTNISGLNLNQSVTDQITRSREKISKTTTGNEAQNTINSLKGCVSTTTGVQQFPEIENLRGVRDFSNQDLAVILNNSLLQQRNFLVANSLNCESNSNIANLVNSKPVGIGRAGENHSRLFGSETKAAGGDSLINKLSATSVDEVSTRKSLGFSAVPYSLPLFSQAPTTSSVSHQLPVPSSVNQQTFPLNSHFLLQNRITVPMDQWRLLEKQLQLQSSAGSVGAILAAYPQYLPNAISPELLWLHYQERLREAILFQQQQQQQQQQQLPIPVSDSENIDSKIVQQNVGKAIKDVSISMVAENLKKEVLSTGSLPQKITDSRIREPCKDSIVERAKDVGHNQIKRSELIVHGTAKVNDAVDQHFTESLRLASQKPSAVVLPSGGNHRNSFASSSGIVSSVCQEPDLITRSRTGLTVGPSESSFLKESQRKIDSTSAALTPIPVSSTLSSSLHLPLALTSLSASTSFPANGLLSASVSSSSTSSSSVPGSVVGNPSKMEPNFNLYGYQPCAIYLPQNAVDIQGFKDDKKIILNEQENRKNPMEKFSCEACRPPSSLLPLLDDGRLRDAMESKNLVLASLGQHMHSPQIPKIDSVNNAMVKNLVLPEKYLASSGDEIRAEGSKNYVVAASASKGHPVFIPVLPIISNGQTSIVKMPTLKDCLSSKAPANKVILGSVAVDGSAIHNGQSFGTHPSAVSVADRAPNGLLTSLPISSAAAVYSFSLSQSHGLHLLQNSVPQSLGGSATVSSSSSLVSSASLPAICLQNASKRDHSTMASETNGLSNDLLANDVKKLKPNAVDLMAASRTCAAAGPAAITLVPNSSFPGTVALCSPNSTKMHLTYSDCFRSFVETTNCVGRSHGAADDQAFQAGSAAGNLERLTVIVSQEGLEEEKYRVLDLKLPSAGSTSIKAQDSFSEVSCADAVVRGTDSDTLSANSPAGPASVMMLSSGATVRPVRSDPVIQKQWQHAKFKKAMLQRYSDEDKKNVINLSQPMEAEAKRPEADHDPVVSEDKEDARSSGSCGGTNNDATSVDSEQDSCEWMSTTDSKNSSSARRKRKSNRIAKSEPPDKAQKLSSDTDESMPSSLGTAKSAQRKKTRNRQTEEDESEDDVADDQMSGDSKHSVASRSRANCLLFLNSSQFQFADCQSKIMKRLEQLKHSKCRDDPSFVLANKALNSNSEEHRQQTMEVFLQDGACRDVTPRLVKCRECKLARKKKDKRVPNDFCRFYAFRRLRYSSKRFLTTAGFSEPCDADALDIELWMPLTPVMLPPVDADVAKYIITYVGNRFMSLVEQEQEAFCWLPTNKKVAWKRSVQGVREMCDICDATLFNVHWVCEKCGFAVCIDCFQIRSFKGFGDGKRCHSEECHLCEHHKRKWLTCSANRQTHEPDQLTMAQIIPSDVLWVAGKTLKQIQQQLSCYSKVKSEYESFCEALMPGASSKDSRVLELSQAIKQERSSPSLPSIPDLSLLADGLKDAGLKESFVSVKREKNCRSLPTFSDLSLLAEAAAAHDAQQMQASNGLSKESTSSGDKCSTLKDLLTKATSSCPSGAGDCLQRPQGTSMQSSLEDIIHKVMKLTSSCPVPKTVSFSHYLPCNRPPMNGRSHPMPKCTQEQSRALFPDVPHSWLDDGRVLRLLSPQNGGNVQLFQQHWHLNLPVVISNCSRLLDNSIWKPETFVKEFGNFESQLINCVEGDEISGHRMKKFWDGFERMSSRLKDKEGRPMVLKLKNWPMKDEFCELMPNHSRDLLQNLPLPEYTKATGPFNLVSRLPEFFAKPELGPKLCCSYGQAKHCQNGTTNLRVDVSDAFNLLVYVGIPKDDPDNQKSVTEALESCGCCQLTKDRLSESGTKSGAVWHIFDPEDADKIRELLNKVASERGDAVELHHDPIYDQSWFLDHDLRDRLNSEYGVQSRTVVQCLGDAVFIPAAAPHQVCNLNSCISITSDFVSPENLDNCFRITQECHHLSNEAQCANHEDRLQVKNIIYHALKDAIAVLQETLPTCEG